MMGLLSVGVFLVSIIFSLILLVLWARVFFSYFRISSLHPISRSIAELTSPVLGPLEVGRYDLLGLGAILVVECIKFTLLSLLAYHTLMPLSLLVLYVLASLIVQPCDFLFYLLLIRVILSWLGREWAKHPMAEVIIIITEPLIRLGHKIIPNISGFDFAPFVVMIILKAITLFIKASMPLSLL